MSRSEPAALKALPPRDGPEPAPPGSRSALDSDASATPDTCAPSRIGWSVTDVPLMAAKGKRKRNDEPKRSLRRRGGRGRPTSWSAWTAARRRRRWPAARRPATADRPRGRPAPRSAPADWLPASTCRRRRTFSVGGPTRSTDRAVSRTHCTNARRTFSFRNPPINLSQSETDSECAKTQ